MRFANLVARPAICCGMSFTDDWGKLLMNAPLPFGDCTSRLSPALLPRPVAIPPARVHHCIAYNLKLVVSTGHVLAGENIVAANSRTPPARIATPTHKNLSTRR